MDEHPNARILRELGDRMAAGDMQAGFDMAADDIVWHEIGRTEPTRGKEAVIQRFQESFGDVEVTSQAHDVVANDEHAVVLAENVARRGNETFEYRTAEIFHMRGGKITERWAFSDDTARIIEFFGP